MHLVDDEFVEPVRYRAKRVIFVGPELRLARPLRRRKVFVIEVFRHRLGIDDDRAAFGAVEILAAAIPRRLALAPAFRIPPPASDLATRREVGAIGDCAVILGDAEHVELVVPAGKIGERGVGGIAAMQVVRRGGG
jgi:hypothetical protein